METATNDFLAELPLQEKAIATRLIQLIRQTIPNLKEKLAYGVPYFYRHSRICFVWPASAPNSGNATGVMLGFCKGNLLSNEQGILEMGNRKEVAIIKFTSPEQINETALREILVEATLVDELARSKKTFQS